MTLSAFGFRQFAQTRHTGTPSNSVAPACELRHLRRRIPPGNASTP